MGITKNHYTTCLRRLAIVSVLAAAACGLSACNDENAKSGNKSQNCDESLMPENAEYCDCIDNEWQDCTYNDDCDPNTEDCDTESQTCKCDDNTPCPENNKAKCSSNECKCDDNTPCPGADKSSCEQHTDLCAEVVCLSGQSCNSETGDCYYITAPALSVSLNQHEISEDNGIATVTISLSAEPLADVTLTLALSGNGKEEAKIQSNGDDITSITIEKDNWSEGVQVDIVAIPDDIVDGNKEVSLDITSTSADESFNHLTGSTSVTIENSNVAELFIEDPGKLETSENSEAPAIKFGFSLSSKPLADVKITLSISNPDYAEIVEAKNDGTFDLVFTPENWNTNQTIHIKGKDDGDVINDSTHVYYLIFSAAESEDPGYAGMQPDGLRLTNLDNDSPEIHTETLELAEGITSELTITLSAPPTVQTTITANIKDGDPCQIDGGNFVTFEANDSDYAKNHTISIRIIDNNDDGNNPASCTITLTGDSTDTNPKTTYKNKTKVLGPIFIQKNDQCGFQLVENPPELYADPSPYKSMDSSRKSKAKYCYKTIVKPKQGWSMTLNFTIPKDYKNWIKLDKDFITINNSNYEATNNCVTVTDIFDYSKPINLDLEKIYFEMKPESEDNACSKKSIKYDVKLKDNAYYGIQENDNNKYILEEKTSESTSYTFYSMMKPQNGSSKFTIQSSNQNTEMNRIDISPTTVTVTSSNWYTGHTITVTAKNDNIKNQSDTEKIIINTDSNFNNIRHESNSFTITDDEEAKIYFNCLLFALYPPKVSTIENGYNGTKDKESLHCAVGLGAEPPEAVTIYFNVTGELSSSDFDGFTSAVTFNKGETAAKSLTFKLKAPTTSITSATPKTGKITATSGTSSYKASDVSIEISKAYPMYHYYYFKYTKGGQSMTLPKGKYKLHAWGASGGGGNDNDYNGTTYVCSNHGGAGAYIAGTLSLNSPEKIYVWVGGKGKAETCNDSCDDNIRISAGFNGGAYGRGGGSERRGYGGGGATDFCIGFNDCANLANHMPYRILVAGGGGGGVATHACYTDDSSAGGNATYYGHSGNGYHDGYTTYSSGTKYYAEGGNVYGTYNGITTAQSARFGYGQNTNCYTGDDGFRRGGGGGGWYGGLAHCTKTKTVGGGAGSSYYFDGTNYGGGKQISKYKVTRTDGYNGSTIMPWYYPNLSSKLVKDTKFGNIGDGYAVIEVMP